MRAAGCGTIFEMADISRRDAAPPARQRIIRRPFGSTRARQPVFRGTWGATGRPMMAYKHVSFFWFAVVGVLACNGGAASTITCGSGTILVGNECEVADGSTVTCAPGTVLVGTLCEPVEAGVLACDAGTVEQDGSCVPVEDAETGCSQPIACTAPDANHASACGRVVDLADSSSVTGAVVARLYDVIALVGNPTSAVPIATVTPDPCGRFAFLSFTPPGSGFVAIVIDDASTANDDRAPTTIARQITNGATIVNINAWSLQWSTDAAWSTSAGLGGESFATAGVWVGLFIDPKASAIGPLAGAPTAGVTATRGGAPASSDDFYFSDATPLARTTVDVAATATGVNGTALLRNSSSLTQSGGQGAEPATCVWSSALAAAPAGLVFVQEDVATCP